VPPHMADRLAASIRSLIAEAGETRRERRERSRRRIKEHFSLGRAVTGFRTTYRELCD
jgi:hypothetical protein